MFLVSVAPLMVILKLLISVSAWVWQLAGRPEKLSELPPA